MEIITAEELMSAKKIWIMAELAYVISLQQAPIPFDSKNPVLSSTNSYLTRLIVEEAHEIVKHNGVRETLTELRRLYKLVPVSFIYILVTCVQNGCCVYVF